MAPPFTTQPAQPTAAQARDRPEAHWQVCDPQGRPQGHYSLWWQQTPTLHGDRLGYLGHWDVPAPLAPAVLHQACQFLAQQGCQRAIAPMDGSTWSAYRALVAPDQGWPFFSEPPCPEATPFLQAGFQPLAHYTSALCTDLRQTDPRLGPVAARFTAQGLGWEPLPAATWADAARFTALLRQLYPLIQPSFRRNLLFSPLEEAAFLARYQPLRPYLQPNLCWLATDAAQVVGFLLAFPDHQAPPSEPKTLVVKTLAIHPARRYAGLGALLLAAGQQAAWEQGYRQAIHALMQQSNPSRALSARWAQPWRAYLLLTRPLAGSGWPENWAH